MQDGIEEKDIVSVHFNGRGYILCHKAEVLHKPCATGDSWIFKDMINDEIHYISEGCTVTLIKKHEKSL